MPGQDPGREHAWGRAQSYKPGSSAVSGRAVLPYPCAGAGFRRDKGRRAESRTLCLPLHRLWG